MPTYTPAQLRTIALLLALATAAVLWRGCTGVPPAEPGPPVTDVEDDEEDAP